jgi:hypothetical protein
MEGIRREGVLVVPLGDWVSKLDLDDTPVEGGELTGGSRLGVDMVLRMRTAVSVVLFEVYL